MSNPTELPDLDRLEALQRFGWCDIADRDFIERPDGEYVKLTDVLDLARRAQPEGEDGYTVDHRELAGKILSFSGISSRGSLEPGADPLADRLAEKLAGWGVKFAQPEGETRCVICGSAEPRTGTCGSDDPRALCKASGKPESEAPQAEMVADANRYVYLASTADWSAIEDLLRRSDAESATELKRDLDKLIDTRLKSAITLPLYTAPAAQHAESGAAAALDFDEWFNVHSDGVQLRHNKTVEELRAALAAQSQGAQASSLTTVPCPCCGEGSIVGCDECDGQGRIIVDKNDLAEHLAAQQAVAPGSLEGRLVSVDVSTSEDDGGNRIFAELTGEVGSDGTTLLAFEKSRNFSAPGTPEAPAGRDVKDAARYRWLRDHHIGDDPEAINLQPAKRSGLNAAVDAAIRAAQLDGGQEGSESNG